jgi:two-component system repressor protein LuxO
MKPQGAALLFITHDPAATTQLAAKLSTNGFLVREESTLQEAEQALDEDVFQLIVLDLDFPANAAALLLPQLKQNPSHPEVIVITSNASVNAAVGAMRDGAYDFLMKPVSPEKILVTARNALDKYNLTETVNTIERTSRHSFQGFIGTSTTMQAVYRMIESAATSKATAFVTGESGTGKEVCASAIHQLSPRAKGPFVALNCAAIPKDLIESEVFGHVKGAFTGATADRDGAARQADGGTLFLDEICEMDLNLQSKLLRFLQTGTFQRVGGSKPEEVDVRIVCATNRDPLAEVQAGRFREDLYYRLHVIPITLPALRERGDDILEISRHLLTSYAKEEKKNFTGFAPEAEQILRHYDWPGNVRQLQNIIRNIVVLHNGTEVSADMIPPPVGGRWARPNGFGMRSSADDNVSGPLHPSQTAHTVQRAPHGIRPLAVVEREAIEQAITVCDGNIPKAAVLLGVSPSTLYRKMTSWQNGG